MQICIKMAPLSGAAAAAPYSHQHLALGIGWSKAPQAQAGALHPLQPPQGCWEPPRHRLTPPAGMWPGHQAMAGSLMPPSKVVCLPQRKGPLLPPRNREKKTLKPHKTPAFQSPRLVWNEFSFLHGCFFKQHGQSWVFCHSCLVCCVVLVCVFFFNIHLWWNFRSVFSARRERDS